MKTAAQIVAYLASFVIALFLGVFFGSAFGQAGVHAKHVLNGKPLPLISEFLIEHHYLLPYLFLFPWLLLVGAPLLALPSARKYWDTSDFALRYLVFLSCEGLFFLWSLLFLLLPFIPIYMCLDRSGPDHSTAELTVQIIFWFCTAAVFLGALGRFYQVRKARNT